jgi:hypothetical protein
LKLSTFTTRISLVPCVLSTSTRTFQAMSFSSFDAVWQALDSPVSEPLA